ATSGSREDLAVAEVRGTLPTNPVALYSMNRMSYPCVRCLAWHRARGAPVPHKRHWGTPGSWYTFPGGGFVRIVITLLPAILMVVSFSVPIHAINTLDVVQFVAQSALATDDWQTQYWIGHDKNTPRCFDNG